MLTRLASRLAHPASSAAPSIKAPSERHIAPPQSAVVECWCGRCGRGIETNSRVAGAEGPLVPFCGPRRRTRRYALFGGWDAHRAAGGPLRLVLLAHAKSLRRRLPRRLLHAELVAFG